MPAIDFPTRAMPVRTRALPLCAVAAVHLVAGVFFLHAAPARERLAEATPLVLRLMALQPDRPAPAPVPLPPAPRLREPVPVPLILPEIAIATATATPASPPSIARTMALAPTEAAAIAVAAPAIEPPRHDLAYLRNPAPAYPALSRRLREQGRVLLRVRVDESGLAREVRIETSSGSERLDHAALEAVRQWRFAPARRGDRPIEGMALVPITFTLDA